jgi:hypothetical protein
MVQAGAVTTTQKRKELTYVPRLENSDSTFRSLAFIGKEVAQEIGTQDQ